MSRLDLIDATSTAPCRCDNCGRLFPMAALALAILQDARMRLTPGEIMPAGECPVCGALAYLDPPPAGSAAAELLRLKAIDKREDLRQEIQNDKLAEQAYD